MEFWIKTQTGNLVKPNNVLCNYEYGYATIITRLGLQSYITLGEYLETDGPIIMEKIEKFITDGKDKIFVMPQG